MPVKAVLFDLWGTLVDGPATLRDDALRRALAAAKVDAPFERAKAAWSAAKADDDDLEARFRRTLGALGASPRSVRHGAKDARARYVQEVAAAARLFPDAMPTLRALPAELRVGVVSNFPDVDVLARTLARLGVSGRLDAAVCSAEAGARKPDPAPFLLALDRMDVYASEAVMVGDGEDDVAGAKRVGMRAVFLARRGEAAPEGADAVVRGLDEVPALLGKP